MSIEAMKQVKTMLQVGMPEYDINDALQVLDEAIAEAESRASEQAEKQEPHSWYSAEHDEWMTDKTRKEHERLNSYTHNVGGFDLPLYTTPPAAPVQEPSGFFRYEDVCGDEVGKPVPYYLAPPAAQRPVVEPHKWVGLTDEEANELWESTDSDWELMKRTEAKLREKNGGQV